MEAGLSDVDPNRTTARVPLRIKVEYACLDDFLDDYTANLSLGGMFVRTDTPMPVDTTFRIRFRLPDRISLIEATATVKWVVEPDDRAGLASGMGVAFDGLSASDERAIQRWLRQYEAELRSSTSTQTGSRAA